MKRVVAGMVDPDPRVSGSGLKMLRAHGVRAAVIGNSSVGDLCRAANAAFIFRVTRRRPYSIVLLYHNSSQICNLLQEESALEAGSRLCQAAPEIDTVIASCEQWRALTRRLAEREFARPEPESESQYCAPAFPPTHCAVVVVFPSGCDFQDWAEVRRNISYFRSSAPHLYHICDCSGATICSGRSAQQAVRFCVPLLRFGCRGFHSTVGAPCARSDPDSAAAQSSTCIYTYASTTCHGEKRMQR